MSVTSRGNDPVPVRRTRHVFELRISAFGDNWTVDLALLGRNLLGARRRYLLFGELGQFAKLAPAVSISSPDTSTVEEVGDAAAADISGIVTGDLEPRARRARTDALAYGLTGSVHAAKPLPIGSVTRREGRT